jgi:hypothetical protein
MHRDVDKNLYSHAEHRLCTEILTRIFTYKALPLPRDTDENLYSYAERCRRTEMLTNISIDMQSAASGQRC